MENQRLSLDVTSSCPSKQSLEALLAGTLEASLEQQYEHHLAECETCQESLDRLAGGAQTLANVAGALGRERHEGLDGDSEPIEDLYAASRRIEPEDWRAVIDPPNESSHDAVIGLLGRFEMHEHIATGGMGIVFKGYDPSAERAVAIKVLAPAWAAIPQSCERFLREACAVALLNHENVMPIYSVEDEGRYPYLVMPFNEGETLEQRVQQQGPMDFESIRAHARAIAEGLEAAHAVGIIHRDLKPANILIREDGLVRLADFGLARAADTPQLTVPGTIPGTPQFMAPEQINGAVVDRRSDYFAFGCLMQFMATGTPPFEGERLSQILKNVTSASPTPISRAHPAWFGNILEKLLEKDPNGRPADVGVIRELLAKDSGSRYSRRKWVLGALALGIPASAGVVTFVRQRSVVPPNTATNMRTKERFNDLHQAVNRAGPYDTLMLNGSFLVDYDLVIPSNRPLHFRGAKGTNARIVTKDINVRCLVSFSDATFEDITFARDEPFPSDSSRHETMVWMRRADEIVFRRCRFEIPWRPDGNDRFWTGVLALGEVKRCVLDRCEMYALSSAALNLTTNRLESSSIVITNSHFASQQFAIRADAGSGASSTNIGFEISHSLIVAKDGYERVNYSLWNEPTLCPFSISVSHSRLHLSESLHLLPNAPENHIRDSVRWQSESATLAFRRFLSSPKVARLPHAPFTVDSFEHAKERQWDVSNTASRIEAPTLTDGYWKLLPISVRSISRTHLEDALPEHWD